MNQHNPDLMWKNQNVIQSTANGNSYDDKGYHGSDKVDCDRSLSNSSFNQFNSKLTPISKVKEYKTYNDIEQGPFADGSFVQNNNDASKMRSSADQPVSDEFLWFYLDPRNNIQGPFLDSQMCQWWSQGIYFQNSLLMKRKCDADFSTLQDYSKRFKGVPFNRKDIRVPPLNESLTIQSPNHSFVDPKMYNNGSMTSTQRHTQHAPAMHDPGYIFQLLSSVSTQSPDDFSKLLQKVNIQQRIPPQMGYEQSLVPASIQNGPDPFLNSAGSSSLSNFVNLRLSNPGTQSQAFIPDVPKAGHIPSYTKNERFPGSSWVGMQPQKLTDSVWTSTTDDTNLSSNPVWSRSTNEPGAVGPSLLNSIFHDAPHKHNSIPVNSHKPNPMQESWDNLDPAIIKIVPLGNSSNHSIDNKLQKENILTNQNEQRGHPISSNPLGTHCDSVKHPWAELVRKGNSCANNQKSKTEHEAVTSDSVSPNQHKMSLTSSSSDEYDQTACESADRDLESLTKWCKAYLENKPGINGVDIGTLIEVLVYVESPYEVEATMRENVPEFDNICEFVKVFVEKRRPLRQRLFSDNPKKKSKSPPKPDEDAKWQVKSKSHGSYKKKRKTAKN